MEVLDPVFRQGVPELQSLDFIADAPYFTTYLGILGKSG